mmetsp:Transcript_65238/g.147138  ORF Transcript_65238/g.147138 Transcript_65238/m.147138 type:complete len:211 (+) Transcript_65238:319-951(+)
MQIMDKKKDAGWADGREGDTEPLSRAITLGVQSGAAGAIAMLAQVALMMPVDTTITYQYRYGLNTKTALRRLGEQGGLGRFYAGVGPALVQGPLSRFGDTASNAAVIALLESREETRNLPVVLQTVVGSVAAASWRVVLVPLDVLKTMAQVRGTSGYGELRRRLAQHGPSALWGGSGAAFASTLCGHLPWYSTYNFLSKTIPEPNGRCVK